MSWQMTSIDLQILYYFITLKSIIDAIIIKSHDGKNRFGEDRSLENI